MIFLYKVPEFGIFIRKLVFFVLQNLFFNKFFVLIINVDLDVDLAPTLMIGQVTRKVILRKFPFTDRKKNTVQVSGS